MIIGTRDLAWEELNGHHALDVVELSKEAQGKIEKCRDYLEQKVASSEHPIYGINTGFGSLCDTEIPNDKLSDLQHNLIETHAAGVGQELDLEMVRLMQLLKIKALSKGHSGVRLRLVDKLIEHYNAKLIPQIFEMGSLGASGDLAPLSHLALPLFGKGKLWDTESQQFVASKTVLDRHNIQPLTLQSKEGLALINGTQFMSAHAVVLVAEFEKLFDWAIKIAAASIELFEARCEPFDKGVYSVRPHAGPGEVIDRVQVLLKTSKVFAKPKKQVQDPYSFRCIPQVLGACWDSLQAVKKVVAIEVNAVTDNPLIFPEEDKIISGGNFHGESIALALEQLKLAMHEVGSISERRTYKMLAGERGLPSYLATNPGLDSGLMIAQYTAASLVSQSKQLCTPAAVDTIDSSQGQEDHVSMGANAATSAKRVLDNLKEVLAIEMLTVVSASRFRDLAEVSQSTRDISDHLKSIDGFDEMSLKMQYCKSQLV